MFLLETGLAALVASLASWRRLVLICFVLIDLFVIVAKTVAVIVIVVSEGPPLGSLTCVGIHCLRLNFGSVGYHAPTPKT